MIFSSNFTSIDIRAHIKCPPQQRKEITPLIETSLFWKTKSTGRHKSRGSAGRSKNFVAASTCLLFAHGRWPRFPTFVCVCVLLFCNCICICIVLFCICIWDFLWLPAVCSSLTAADPGFVFLYGFVYSCFVFVFVYCCFEFVFETYSGCQLFAPQSRPLTLVLSILLICAPWDNFLLGGAVTIFLIGGWCWNKKPWLRVLIAVLHWQVRHCPPAQMDIDPFSKVKSCPSVLDNA